MGTFHFIIIFFLIRKKIYKIFFFHILYQKILLPVKGEFYNPKILKRNFIHEMRIS